MLIFLIFYWKIQFLINFQIFNKSTVSALKLKVNSKCLSKTRSKKFVLSPNEKIEKIIFKKFLKMIILGWTRSRVWSSLSGRSKARMAIARQETGAAKPSARQSDERSLLHSGLANTIQGRHPTGRNWSRKRGKK